jgi:hypothetical protein
VAGGGGPGRPATLLDLQDLDADNAPTPAVSVTDSEDEQAQGVAQEKYSSSSNDSSGAAGGSV